MKINLKNILIAITLLIYIWAYFTSIRIQQRESQPEHHYSRSIRSGKPIHVVMGASEPNHPAYDSRQTNALIAGIIVLGTVSVTGILTLLLALHFYYGGGQSYE